MFYEGSEHPRVVFVSDYQRVHCLAEKHVFSEWLGSPLTNAIKAAGIKLEDHGFICLHGANDGIPGRIPGALETVSNAGGQPDLALFKQWLNTTRPNIIVPLGEYALDVVTGLKGIGKWQSSLVSAKAEYGGVKCLPMFHPDHVSRVWSDHFFFKVGCRKLAIELQFPELRIPARTFHLSPPLEQTLEYLDNVVARAATVAIDWEFGRGQLNCVGFAISPTEAIAIKCLPQDYSASDYFRLFDAIRRCLEGPSAKVIQHSIIEVAWMARYGIQIENVTWDTMLAMKYLHPEMEMGLGNVGRIYTPYPYWKDDNDDWNNISNWGQHLEYNCKDTTGTFAAYENQKLALAASGQLQLFQDFVMEFQPVIQEMCVTGLLVSEPAVTNARERLIREHDNFKQIIEQAAQEVLGKPLNVRSPKQLQEFLKACGMKLPTKRVKGKTDEQESADKKSLVKLKRKYPDNPVLPALIGISAVNKRISSYTDFAYDRTNSRVHYSLNGCGTETGRWSGRSAPWYEGFNPQTVPKAVRNCFIADPGKVLVQVDLKQAESRYVAWDGPDPKLMQLLADGQDIHSYVAASIFNKPIEFVSPLERQLGKKAGHAANYGTGPRTFAEACLVEMNHYLTEKEAKDVLEGYHRTFPGIRRRQERIKREVYNKRVLRTPIGRERHFYGRMEDATFREAYAYAPQSTIPDITNYLMLKLWRDRDYLGLAWDEGGRFLLQVHDSLLLQTNSARVSELADFCRDLSQWHPEIHLAGGQLLIPVDVEAGVNWKNMEKV